MPLNPKGEPVEIHASAPGKVPAADVTTMVAVAIALPLAVLSMAILVAAIRLPAPVATGPDEQHKQESAPPLTPNIELPPAPKSASEKSEKVEPPSPSPEQPTPSKGSEPAPQSASTSRAEPSSPVAAEAKAQPPAPAALSEQTGPRNTAQAPLALTYDREAYSFLSELKAAIDSEAWEDAARLLTRPWQGSSTGLAPAMDDKSLATSLPVAIEIAHQEHPLLREALGEQYRTLAGLRVAEAIRLADREAIELAVTQFVGTPAAAQAHRWLADHALAVGRFERAVAHYQAAVETNAALASQLGPRLRLASALCGREAGSPVIAEVALADQTLSAEDFEALVAEMRQRYNQRESFARASDYSRDPPPPGQFAVRPVSSSALHQDAPSGAASPRTDQVTAVIERNVAYVCDGLRLFAHDIARGEKLWDTSVLPSSRTGRWRIGSVRPLVLGDRVVFRALELSGPRLVCLETATGSRLWATDHSDRVHLISDPVIVEGQLAAFSLVKETDQQEILRLHVLDRRTGRHLHERDVIHLRSAEPPSCEVVTHGGNLLVTTSGVLLACSLEGDVHWIRTLPLDGTNSAAQPQARQPLVHEGRVFITDNGGNDLLSIDANTGRQHWTAELPDSATLAGAGSHTLVVSGPEGVFGLSCIHGKEQWRFDAKQMACLPLSGPRHVLVVQSEPSALEKSATLRLTWLDPTSGEPMRATTIAKRDQAARRISALVPYKNGLLGVLLEANGPRLLELEPAAHARGPSRSRNNVDLFVGAR